MESQHDKFPELLKLEKQCKLFSREAAWIADYPDGDNFMQLFYGPNAYQSNNACATIPEYDALYKKSHRGCRPVLRATSSTRRWRGCWKRMRRIA